ncbi:cryptochrome/photolyase family protein [Actinacidiphila bryophytorum]|uniref:Deoxyribodipyrimidine photo-lyase n=1 Tax=Actinacidiphila bryophytorum TaxID=1436133 RepID=A0A9W4MIK1_9ACTN|nr:deoxyribodipyrimidine photo-lyase [Actinacidiphila bryophytorum]MBM9438095.1 deoxyribodipyrimidine photo-lyase [Actinacidiphila bryophytorum]MBN6545677.1 deoxyribodipyrimidine photo-lyase [Actinacidiphila bryophytorum]CAG7647326.1 Deoxyribodipyrimidine photo-lyase [Actinacidiphila bryophytorum]
MRRAVVLFTGDLRLHDHPALRAAIAGADEVVPLFVLDPAVARAGFAAPVRQDFLAGCLADLDAGLRERGGRLVVRSGEPAAEVCAVAAECDAAEVHVAAADSGFGQRREDRLRAALAGAGRRLHVHDTVVTAVPPGALTPQASDHFAVFTPYFRHWSAQRLRDTLPAPRTVRVPDAVGSAGLPEGGARGAGEGAARRRLSAWLRGGLGSYGTGQDDLAADATSRLSAHLHFGTLSPVETVHRVRSAGGPGAAAFVRQLCWRDFNRQVLAARTGASVADYRTRQDRWRTGKAADADADAWREGRTGYPMVDAAMRQLAAEGWMHNRGRLLVASFLTKTLYVDWRVGARHFLDLLVDGDVANNQLNWQWVAGTGTDTRPNRVLNPVLQARRHDPDGEYVRRWVPELAAVPPGAAVHEPWKLPEKYRKGYPAPVLALSDGLARFRRARGLH